MSKPYLLVFPGQGSHGGPLGAFWAKESAVFKESYNSLLSYFKEKFSDSLEDIVYKYPEKLDETQWAQPAIYCYQVAMAKMLMSSHKPDAVLGSSLGEFAAVVVAGAMDEYATLELVAQRGALMQQTAAGKMIAAFCGTERITSLLERHPNWACWISAENDDNVTILAGNPQDIDLLTNALSYLGVRFITVPVYTAFHTPMMESIANDWASIVSRSYSTSCDIAWYSSVDGKKHKVLPDDYWLAQMFARIRFKQALNMLYHDYPTHVCIEVGPGNKYQSYLKKRWTEAVSLGPESQGKDLHNHLNDVLYYV